MRDRSAAPAQSGDPASPGPRETLMPASPSHRPAGARKRGGRIWPPIALLAAAAGGLAVFLSLNPPDEPRWDADMCPVDGTVAHRAAYLIDARKPLDADLAELPGRLLERVTLDLASGTELRIYTLGPRADTPRQAIGRICKPYGNADLQVAAAKDQRAAVRDCSDLPSQISTELREVATGFCSRRAALRSRIDAVATPDIGETIAPAYLVEAIAETLQGGASPAATAVYVYSDMMQHADWYSHVDAGPAGWRIEDAGWPDRPGTPAGGFRPDQRVTVFYLPRTGLTDEPGMELLHKRFWRAFLDPAQATFHNQPPSLGYAPPAAAPQAPVAAEPAPATDEEREHAERLLAEIADREAELAAAERRLASQREEERQQQERLAALQERLADLDRPPEPAPDPDADVPADPPPDALPANAGSSPGDNPVDSAAGDAAMSVADAAADGPVPAGTGADGPDAAAISTAPEPAPPPVAELAAPPSPPQAARDEARPSLDAAPVCDLAHKPGNAMPAYPSRNYMGNATIVVEFAVDDSGATVDDTIGIARSRSSAERANRFDRFGDAAVAAVRGWEFASAGGTDCRMAQRTAVPIEFRPLRGARQ